MQVQCKASHLYSDIRCQVCGQGFLVYWTRCGAAERESLRTEVLKLLREHHAADQSTKAHPMGALWTPEPRSKEREGRSGPERACEEQAAA